MKTRLLTALLALGALASFAQGTVDFANIDSALGLDAPVYSDDASFKLSGPDWVAELFAGPTLNTMSSVATTGFLTGAASGYFNGGTVTIAKVKPGSKAWLMVRIFAIRLFSFDNAVASQINNVW